jgi:hypothetical protein
MSVDKGNKFEFLPDGDDPGTGWIRETDRDGRIVRQWQASRFEWEQFRA